VAQEQTNLEIMLQAKKKEISVQTEEKKKMEIDAEAYKTAEILKAQGDAEALRLQKQVKFEAEAEAIRLKMAAQAEGLQKQVDALSSGDERFMAVKLVEILPQIFENINPDKMIVMGEGKSAFNSLANSILPFMELIPSFVQGMKGVYNKSELNGDGVE
jgi:flotillin